MSQRSIKSPAGRGSVSVKSVAADAAELRALRGKTRNPNAAFVKAVTPSPQLAAVIGDKAVPRTEVTKRVWDYIKKNGLQDEAKRTMINADAKLKEIFKKARVSKEDVPKLVSGHLK